MFEGSILMKSREDVGISVFAYHEFASRINNTTENKNLRNIQKL